MTSLRVYIGHDRREQRATEVAVHTLYETSRIQAEVLDNGKLQARGLLTRPVDRRGQMYDMISSAPMSTDFAISRFLVPILCQQGWALFTDCDVVFMQNVGLLLNHADPRYAVQVVQHQYTPATATKMDSQPQLAYSRKNWSSVCLWNCDHPANQRLTLHDVNTRRGLWLHQFSWLHESEIGCLPAGYNWLVGEQPRPVKDDLMIAHFTLGTPNIEGRESTEHADIWFKADERTPISSVK